MELYLQKRIVENNNSAPVSKNEILEKLLASSDKTIITNYIDDFLKKNEADNIIIGLTH